MSIKNYSSNWNRLRERVYERDDHRCQHCDRRGGPGETAELRARHIVPKSRGGMDHPRNLLTLCRKCTERVNEHHVLGSGGRVTQMVMEGPTNPSSGTSVGGIGVLVGGSLFPLMTALLVLML
ncbi:MAG: HNH endonuclease [Haloarculaceae archaeon]